MVFSGKRGGGLSLEKCASSDIDGTMVWEKAMVPYVGLEWG